MRDLVVAGFSLHRDMLAKFGASGVSHPYTQRELNDLVEVTVADTLARSGLSRDTDDPLHVPSEDRVAALAGMEEELAELSRRDPPASRGRLGTLRARIAEVRAQLHRHRCLRCSHEFECQSPTECIANYDVLPSIVTRGANGQPQLADHCAQDADGKWQPVAARSSGADTPKQNQNQQP